MRSTPGRPFFSVSDFESNSTCSAGLSIGGGARATNYDYTKGELPALLDVIINSGAKLFVCAIGVPPTWAVERLHKAGIVVQNMIGSPKHVAKALAAGVDVICAQVGGSSRLAARGCPI